MNTSDCVKVLTIEMFPFTTTSKVNGETTLSGSYFEILFATAKHFNFCCNVTSSQQQTWGVMVNGTFTGALGSVQRKEADLLLTPSIMSTDRYQAVDFSNAIDIDAHSIMYRYPVIAPNYAGFVEPFSLNTWIVIWFSTFVLIGIFEIIFKILNVLNRRSPAELRSYDPSSFSFYVVFGGLTSQPARFIMMNQSARFAICVWIMCMFIVGSVYKSNLSAMLTTPKLQIPFETLEEAVDQKTLKIILYKGTFIDQFIKSFNKGTNLRKLSDDAIRMNINIEDYDKLIDANTHALSMVKSGIDGFIHKAFIKNGHCTRTRIPTTFLPISMGIAFQKNSTYIKNFNHVIAAFTEGGIYNHLQNENLTKLSFCTLFRGAISQESRKLTLSDFVGIFFLFGAGMVMAAATFVTELMMKKVSALTTHRYTQRS